MLGSVAEDGTVILFDRRAGKALYQGHTAPISNIHFVILV